MKHWGFNHRGAVDRQLNRKNLAHARPARRPVAAIEQAMQVKVIHRHKNGSETNFGCRDFPEVPDVGTLIEGNRDATWRVRVSTIPPGGATPTIIVEDVESST